MPFLVRSVVLAFRLDLAHVLTRSDHDRAVVSIVAHNWPFGRFGESCSGIGMATVRSP
jgi:hypothetical protein